MIGCRRAVFEGSKSNSNISTRLAASSRLSLSFFALAGWPFGIPNLLFLCTLAMFATLSLVFYWICHEFTFTFRSFDIERSDVRSSLTLHISVAGQWLSPLCVNPYSTRDCLRLNNRIKWRTRNIHRIKNIFSTHTVEIHQKLYLCVSFSVSFQLVSHIDVNSGYRSPFITSSRNSNWPYNSVVNKSMSPPPPIT